MFSTVSEGYMMRGISGARSIPGPCFLSSWLYEGRVSGGMES